MKKINLILYYFFLLFSISSVVCAINDFDTLLADKVIANVSVLYIVMYTALIVIEHKIKDNK